MEIHISANQTKSINKNGKITSAVITCHTTKADPAIFTNDDVLEEVLKVVPDKVGAASLSNAEIVEYHGSGVYEIEVNYDLLQNAGSSRKSISRIQDEKWYLTTSNSVEHILFALETTAYGQRPPDPGNLIHWNGQTGSACSSSGANIISSTLRENCVLTIPAEKYNTSLRKRILSMTGHVNSPAFHGWAAGEVLFLGANTGAVYLNDEGDELIDITFKFAIRPNRKDIKINDIKLSAQGWEIAWPLGRNHVYVSKIYPTADLRCLGIGK